MVWACASCTLENSDALNTCDVCGAAAPLASGWACAACTFANAEGVAECAMCGAAAPAAGAAGTTTGTAGVHLPKQIFQECIWKYSADFQKKVSLR